MIPRKPAEFCSVGFFAPAAGIDGNAADSSVSMIRFPRRNLIVSAFNLVNGCMA